MAKYLVFKTLVYRFVIPLISAGAVIALLVHVLAGPVLSPEYDFLLEFRQSPPIARDILAISVDDSDGTKHVISPFDVSQVVVTLAEMSASSLLILSPVFGVKEGGNHAAGSEIIYRFDEEFKTINSNVKNLFDGIKLGSIEPKDTSHFVDEVITLIDQSKERLLSASVQTKNAGAVHLEQTIAVFDNVYMPKDIGLSFINSVSDDMIINSIQRTGYSHIQPDYDGKIRRIAPFIENNGETLEHTALTALKQTKKIDENIFSLLDSTGAFLFEAPKHDDDFKTIPLSLFLEYEDLDKTLYKLLTEDMSLATYSGVSPDKYPAFLYEKAAHNFNNLLEKNTGELKTLWLDSRTDYYRALADFFGGDTRNNISMSFEKIIEEGKLNESGREKLLSVHDGVLRKYDISLDIYRELSSIRKKISSDLSEAFCILGGSDTGVATQETINSARISALLANTILTGSAVSAVNAGQIILYSMIPAFILILIILRLRLIASFIWGALGVLGVYAWFCYSFVLSGQWLDPAIPAAAMGCAWVSSLFCAVTARAGMVSGLRRSFSAIVSAKNLRRLIKTKNELPRTKAINATIVVIYYHGLVTDKNNACKTSDNIEKFRAEVKNIFVKEGAVITGCGTEYVVAAFGSPLENLAVIKEKTKRSTNNIAGNSTPNKAARLIITIISSQPKTPWRFGIDYGECCFFWSPLTGYTVIGRAVTHAKSLSRLCLQYKVKSLVSDAAQEKITPSFTKKINSSQKQKKIEDCYELITVKKKSSYKTVDKK
ncbi:MAG: hypothetical protein LBD07_03660 [Spirochaetaceae bacterium]|nr:hypothetical protein [Spirochaetaceae bacterium]